MTRATGIGPLVVGAAVATAAACAATSTPSPSPAPPVPQAIEPAVLDHLATRPWLDGITAVVVLQGGEPVAELYRGSTEEDHHDVFSVTKSVLGTLVGAALADGSLRSVDQTLAELLPAHAPTMTPDVAATTLEHLLTMTAGLPDQWSGGGVDRTDGDWVAQILASAVRPPGGRFAYSDDGAHLVAAVLVQATGMPLLEYARTALFDPLGIDTEPAFEPSTDPANIPAYEAAGFAWPVDPQGIHLGASLLKLRTLDMAALGQLHLDGGLRDGVQVVPAEWVAEATAPQVEARGAADDYGYLWWVGALEEHPAFFAWGYGGQLVEVVPDLDLVVAVSTSWPLSEEGSAPVSSVDVEGLLRDAVLPAVSGGRDGSDG